jgi:hypothetical protein
MDHLTPVQWYLLLYWDILWCGAWTIFVFAALLLFGCYMKEWVKIGVRLINRHFERRMRSGHIAKQIKKVKKAAKEHFSLGNF